MRGQSIIVPWDHAFVMSSLSITRGFMRSYPSEIEAANTKRRAFVATAVSKPVLFVLLVSDALIYLLVILVLTAEFITGVGIRYSCPSWEHHSPVLFISAMSAML